MGIFDKAKDALDNKEATDKVLDKAEDVAKDKLGEDKSEHVDKVRGAIDDKLGDN